MEKIKQIVMNLEKALRRKHVALDSFNDKLQCPIFIWGCPHSGTTLLYQLISQHPDVGFPKNSGHKPIEGTKFWWQAFGEHRGVMTKELASPKRVHKIRRDYNEMLERDAKNRLLEKTPFMTLWIPLVNEVFPDARHFHIIRDGRAVVNSILYKLRYSQKDKDKRFKEEKLLYGPKPQELISPMSLTPAQRHVKQWILLVQHGRKNRNILGDRYYELRYEDLVKNSRIWMGRILKHAKLDYDDIFINKNYPEELENRNYKWESLNFKKQDNGFTVHRAINENDLSYFDEMNDLLFLLGYLQREPSKS